MNWYLNPKPQATIVLIASSLTISGCDRGLPQVPAGLFASRQAQEAGKIAFAANCSICHGVNADGNGQRREGMSPPPANLTLPPWSEQSNARQTFLAIRNGVRGTAMAGWRVLGEQKIWELVAYIGTLPNQ
jgi:mono/diheme cytochrome c family protein